MGLSQSAGPVQFNSTVHLHHTYTVADIVLHRCVLLRRCSCARKTFYRLARSTSISAARLRGSCTMVPWASHVAGSSGGQHHALPHLPLGRVDIHVPRGIYTAPPLEQVLRCRGVSHEES